MDSQAGRVAERKCVRMAPGRLLSTARPEASAAKLADQGRPVPSASTLTALLAARAVVAPPGPLSLAVSKSRGWACPRLTKEPAPQ